MADGNLCYVTLPPKIRTAVQRRCKQHKLTQKILGIQYGVTQAAVSAWFTGKSGMPLDYLFDLYVQLGRPAEMTACQEYFNKSQLNQLGIQPGSDPNLETRLMPTGPNVDVRFSDGIGRLARLYLNASNADKVHMASSVLQLVAEYSSGEHKKK